MECFSCLLKHGATLEAMNLQQHTPLDVARKFGNPKAISKAGMDESLVYMHCFQCESIDHSDYIPYSMLCSIR